MQRSSSVLTAIFAASLVLTAPVWAAKETFDRSKPHVNITVSSGDINMRGFQNFDLLAIDVEVIEYQDGDDLILRKRPGRAKYGNITLKRGWTGQQDAMRWAEQTLGGKAERRDLNVAIFLRKRDTPRVFNLLDCFPTSWKLTTDDKGRLIETLVVEVGKVEQAR